MKRFIGFILVALSFFSCLIIDSDTTVLQFLIWAVIVSAILAIGLPLATYGKRCTWK